MSRSRIAKAAAVAFLAFSLTAIVPALADQASGHGNADTHVTATTIWQTTPVGKDTTIWETAPVGKDTTIWE
ncbi:hypothetical protein [Streptomyces sp. NPDC096339]|uniref:hypothetical protein n=1 Tax=Streptomyces sp. NPDC096339 TaxID=3366086 RepID=UPI003812ED75